MQQRYVVKKESGSYQAKVIDTKSGKEIKSYDVRRGGWDKADAVCGALNKEALDEKSGEEVPDE